MKKRPSLLALLCILIFGLSPGARAVVVPVDTSSSLLKWYGHKVVGADHWGHLKLKSGTLDFQNGQLAGGTLEIDMRGLTVGDMEKEPDRQAKLATHLKSDDFFSAEKFPTARFILKTVKPLDKAVGDATHEITGDLTVKGKTNPLKFNARLVKNGSVFQASAKPVVDRTLYDVRFGSGKFFQGLADKAISDDFEVEFNLLAKTSAEEKKK